MIRIIKTGLLICCIAQAALLSAGSFESGWALELKGKWLMEIGDNSGWADPEWNDEHWREISVPGSWEDQGFPDYDGYAWIRFHFRLGETVEPQDFALELGRIDDVDETYINGTRLGSSGGFPPNYQTHYYQPRRYYLPSELLKYDEMNVLAIRIYDHEGAGGLMDGPVQLIPAHPNLDPSLNLTGVWQFFPGDNSSMKERIPELDIQSEILAPLAWECQGFGGLGGIAWYRKEFFLPENPARQKLLLVIGSIDDKDQTFINGQMIGQTGHFTDNISSMEVNGFDYAQLRIYSIPSDLLNWGGQNVIAVRVYDGPEWGGITTGPICIASSTEVQNWLKKEYPGHLETLLLGKLN